MILNPNKTKALFVSRSKTVNPPHGDLVLSVVSIHPSPILDILGVKFDITLTFEKCAWYCFPSLSGNFYFGVVESYICEHLCVTSLRFCICGGQLLNVPPGVGVSC